MSILPLLSNKNVRIFPLKDKYKIICLKKESTPGVYSKINVKKLIKRYFKIKNFTLTNKNNLINEIKFSKAKNNYLKLIKCKIPSVNLKKYLDNSLIEVK